MELDASPAPQVHARNAPTALDSHYQAVPVSVQPVLQKIAQIPTALIVMERTIPSATPVNLVTQLTKLVSAGLVLAQFKIARFAKTTPPVGQQCPATPLPQTDFKPLQYA
jgi:hypothetical protein